MQGNDGVLLTEIEAKRYFDLEKALKEFHALFVGPEKDNRAIAILGGTFLEMILEHILFAFLPDDEKEVEKVMKQNQPIGTFSNKITLAFCVGLIDKIIKDDLNLVRKIRNEFAHNLYASFENQDVKSWCLQLQWHKILITPNPPVDADIRDYFEVGVNTLITHLYGCVGIARSEKRKIRSHF